MIGYIKIVGGPMTRDVQVFFVKDSEEIDISHCVKSVAWIADVTDTLASVTLDVLPGDVEIVGELKEIIGGDE